MGVVRCLSGMAYQPDRLETSLRDQLGERLRSFWTYDADGDLVVRLVRSDLSPDALAGRAERTLARADEREPSVLRGGRDDVVAVRLPHPDGAGGVGFTAEADVTRDPRAFLDTCEAALGGAD